VERFYTVSEANAMLPALTQLLEEMRAQSQQLAALKAREVQTNTQIKGNGHHDPTEDTIVSGMAQHSEEAIRQGINQLADWGIELKDISTGLVDFPALRQGYTVFLCWRLGEPEVAFWHEIADGFAGRQPIDDL
jgi:hypothetical protein